MHTIGVDRTGAPLPGADRVVDFLTADVILAT
jgi:hypothetical protein